MKQTRHFHHINLHHARRGNALVLVAGILVLLVIIATAYFSRTNTEREIMSAQHDSSVERTASEEVGNELAQMVTRHLFLGEYDEVVGLRRPPQANAVRYGRDPNHDFNFAPYAVFPWTNWPDDLNRPDDVVGNPSFGDHRWLAEHEPLRIRLDNGLDVYAQWRKLSSPIAPERGWRLVADISDVDNWTVPANADYVILPIEQWPTDILSTYDADDLFNSNASDFFDRWEAWFGLDTASGATPLEQFETALTDPDLLPPNLFHLRELGTQRDAFTPGTARWHVSRVLTDTDGDGFTDSFWWLPPWPATSGIRHVVGIRIIDNSAMLNVNTATRFMRNDLDPLPLGIEQDNSRTFGATPSDVALIGEGFMYALGDLNEMQANWNTGLLDNPLNHMHFSLWPTGAPTNWPDVQFGPWPTQPFGGLNVRLGAWPNGSQTPYPFAIDDGQPNQRLSFINALGVSPDDNASFPERFATQLERMWYWQWAGSRPNNPQFGLTPFGPSDELSLRAFHGNNFAWANSRLEKAIQKQDMNNTGQQILRSNAHRHESNELLHQLSNPEHVLDVRKHLTTRSGARNDIMPPWLWDTVNEPEQKFDLRTPRANRPNPDDFGTPDEYDAAVLVYLNEHQDLAVELRDLLQRALSDQDADQSYYGSGGVDKTEDMAASMAANILTWRDPLAVPLSLEEAIPETGDPGIGATWPRNIGMQRQPFLVEAFVAHVHGSRPIPVDGGPIIGPDGGQPPPEYWGPDEGFDYYVTYEPGGDPRQTTVVAVQIANPFDKPVDLREYSIRVAGTTIDLSTIPEIQNDPWLHAATEEYPRTAVFYSIVNGFDGRSDFRAQWIDFLDINDADEPGLDDLAPGSRAIEVTGLGWSSDRDSYDSVSTTPIELLRRVPETANLLDTTYVDVVVDRFDGESDSRNSENDAWTFAQALEDLGASQVPSGIPPQDAPDPDNDLLPGIRLEDEDDYFVSWARVTRAWGYDFNRNEAGTSYGDTAGINANERNPRFVFAQQLVTWSRNPNEGNLQGFRGDENNPSIPPESEQYIGSGFNWSDDSPDDPWFQHSYATAPPPVPDTGDTPSIPVSSRKPTFFNLHPVSDMGGNDIYPSFDDATFGYGRYFYWDGNTHTEDIIPNPKRAGIPDKGFYGHGSGDLRFPMQMLQKDDDFQQIGELNLIWRWGHRITDDGAGNITTTLTFAERMADNDELERRVRVNRLDPRMPNSIIGEDTDPSVPRLPAAVRVLDAFVCDGEGVNPRDINENGIIEPWEVDAARYRNANSMSGRITPGLININTAPVEVLRSLPHMYKVVDGRPVGTGDPDGWIDHTIHPRVAVPEAIAAYRDLMVNGVIPGSPDYSDRDDLFDDLRPQRGFESIGELQLLDRPGTQDEDDRLDQPIFTDAWRVDFAGFVNNQGQYNHPLGDPFFSGEVTNTRLSTNTGAVYFPAYSEDPINPPPPPDDEFLPTRTGGDALESNLLFSGLSNMVTTRSDVFTIYFKVRSFRQRQSDLVWDATDRNQIVAERRYVMVVDRSEVNSPGDQPKILLFEELPN